MRWLRIVLIIVAVACFGVALSYPIRYRMAQQSNNSNMEQLSALRAKGQTSATDGATDDEKPVDGNDKPKEAPDAMNAEPTEVAGQASAKTPAPSATAEALVNSDSEETAEAGQLNSEQTETSGGDEVPMATESVEAAGLEGETEDAITQEPVEAERPQRSPDAKAAGAGDDIAESGESEAPRDIRTPEASPETEVSEPASKEDASGAVSRDDVSGTKAEGSESEDDIADTVPTPGPTLVPGTTPDVMDLILDLPEGASILGHRSGMGAGPRSTPEPTPEPSPTPNRRVYTGPLPYPMKEKVELDLDAMLPELKEVYELNHELVGWITIPDTIIDYPVVQTEDSEFYLSHDFYGEENVNGQIILDTLCDPYTPSYNLIISGHHMKNGSMFGDLPLYSSKGYWASHRFVEFDTLMTRKQYVIFAAFYSADYDEDEEGFRYNANLQYELEVDQWLAEVRENQLYDTEIDAEFGDEFITLTTCNRARHRNGRFVVVCRKIREGETFE